MWRTMRLAMDGGTAVRRLQRISGIFSRSTQPGHSPAPGIVLRCCSSKSGDNKVINLGDVSMTVKEPKRPELVPAKYIPENIPQSLLRHLRWIMQKDLLGQDVFLIGPPGPLRRSIAMMYLELTGKEAEYVSLSRDTTDTDLKQRREIVKGTAYHIDQSAVKAATQGRVLILEGIEKAERNVLPVLNNLLENREMQLDDGRFLMSSKRYDQLLEDHSKEELDAWNLVRVNPDFRVFALGLPVPRYQGNPLDPPLRSRFQARDVNPLPFQDQVELMKDVSPGISPERMSQILSFANTMKSTEANTLGLPDFPLDNLPALFSILSAVPSESASRLLHRLYPYDVMLNKEGISSVKDALKSFDLLPQSNEAPSSVVSEVKLSNEGATVQLNLGKTQHTLQLQRGALTDLTPSEEFVSTKYHDQLLADMMESHLVKDLCIIGPRGSGKSVLAKQFADLLGYHIEPIMLYQDMTSRDLLQQRMTLPNGDTTWRPSPLVTAALEGSLAVLDGVHRVNAGTFAVLHRLIHDRELTLFDGTRLLSKDKYEHIKQENDLSDEDMASRSILAIDPSFRILALSEPPVIGSTSQQWMSAEVLTMFFYHHLRALNKQEEMQVMKKLVPNMSDMKPILELTHKLRSSADSNLKSVAASLSTRQLLRIAKRLSTYPSEDLYGIVQKACLARFLPRLARTALEEELECLDITKPALPNSPEGYEKSVSCEIKDGVLRIGTTTVPVYNTETKMKVPDVLFYENPQHLSVMEDMLKDFLLGEHLLLVGNQGVGKNKIVDRFLYLLNRPREYIQLHRDTTVQTLTLQPTVHEGIIRYEDSPLVKAVKSGHILVVDEADKAPTNVTCILKTLVESGEMHLADGRRIVTAHSGIKGSDRVIVAHPDFRMLVLANRPGFPFLGNDFFGALGDIFSCHSIDNPDTESEMSMLRQYGPDVPDHILRKLVLSFGELREQADQGLINYPYSTREVVNMVKHLQMFPDEGLASVVKNVLDFDSYNKELSETVTKILQKHGIPIGADPRNVSLAKEIALPKLQHVGKMFMKGLGERKKTGLLSCPVEDRTLKIKGPLRIAPQSFPLEREEARSLLFSEQEAYWSLPLHETAAISDVAVALGRHSQPVAGKGDVIHIATVSPVSLYTMDPRSKTLTCIDLYDLFPTHKGQFAKPRIKIAPLGFPLDKQVLFHDEVTNSILNINTETGDVSRLETSSFLEAATEKLTRNFRQAQGSFRMCNDFTHESDGMTLFYKEKEQNIEVFNLLEGRAINIELPIKVANVNMLSREKWLLTESETNNHFILSQKINDPYDYTLIPLEQASNVNINDASLLGQVVEVGQTQLPNALLSAALNEKIESPNRVIANRDSYVTLAVGMPELSSIDIHVAPRDKNENPDISHLKDAFSHLSSMKQTKLRSRPLVTYLPGSGQIVRAVPSDLAPKDAHPYSDKMFRLSGYLEVVDPISHKVRYVPVPGVTNSQVYNQWFSVGSRVDLVMAPMSEDGLVTVDSGGCVRLWETAPANLERSIMEWKRLIGEGDNRRIQLTIDKLQPGKRPEMPKHGKMDPTGAPHVGGNTWAGGTGGRDTAGLGGVGGPYRLDAGHDVHQVSDADKEAVPPEVKEAARQMALKAWKDRLKEIQMTEYDAELYERFSESVRKQVKSTRVILDSLQAKSKERQWLHHQTHGDLDDAKLIEGLTGERGIYKRRGEKDPELGSPQQKPKHLTLLCDVSGSMYRFNGYDGRLEREMEAMVMCMEAFEGYEHKIKYEIIGHSGEGPRFGMLASDKPPKNNKERLNVVKTLHAHSQFCLSGDHTLEATKLAIQKIADADADERFVICLSDANLERYGIRPKAFADILTSNEDVNAYVIFIGSLGDQAHRLIKQMPAGRAFICMDTKNLPQIVQQIFTSTMLNS